MRHLLFMLLLLPAAGYTQTEKDYAHAMAKFVSFYNHKQGDSIRYMWPADMRERLEGMWNTDAVASLQDKYGKIRSCKYIGIDTDDPSPGLAVFKTKFSKAGWKTTSLTLDKNNYLAHSDSPPGQKV